jgi:pSer/pThr/pTyr-binding forkhead associated (FHA) protein
MPLRLRIIPSARTKTGQGKGPTQERTIEFGDTVSEVRIGRRPDLELPLPFSVLSNVHARLVRSKTATGEQWFLEDLGSRNGTFLAGVKLGASEKRPVNPGASISLAQIDLMFDGPAKEASTGSEGTGTIARRLVSDLFAAGPEASVPTVMVVSGAPNRGVLKLEELDRPYTVGRVEGCDLRLAVEEISREHASFTRKWNGVFVADMGSKNGVRVSGVLAATQRVRDGDLIQIGPVSLRLFDPEDRYLRDFESRAAEARAAAPPPPPGPPPESEELHPAIAGALAAEGHKLPAPKRTRTDKTGFRVPPNSTRAVTLVAALVLAVIAAVAVTLAFG